MMDRNALVPVMAIAIVNGIFSPFVLFVFSAYFIWYPGWLPPYTQIVYMMSALILSTLTIMISGIPAALYAASPSANVARVLWFAGAAFLSLPAVPNVLRALGMV